MLTLHDYVFYCLVLHFNSVHCDNENNIITHVVSQSPAIMHMLDKSGSCGKFDTYQRPEGFPVGTSEYSALKRGCCTFCIRALSG